VRPFVSPQIAHLPHSPARAGSRQWLARRDSQSCNKMAEPIVEQAYWRRATLRLATRRVTTPCSVTERREDAPWA
jgi:hypothetical protein